MATAELHQPHGRAFEHLAFFYATMDEFLAFMVPFVSGGLDEDEPVFVAVGSDCLEALRREIGGAEGVHLVDTREWHPNPTTRLRAFYEFVTDELRGGAARLRLVGEPVWPAGPPELVLEWARYESVLNEVLGPFPVTLACTYDTSRLDPAIVATARRTHPIVRHGKEIASLDFEEPAQFLCRSAHDLPPAPNTASLAVDSVVDLLSARSFLEEQALLAGLRAERALDLVIAANELLTNTLLYVSGSVVLRAWVEGDGHFVCEIEDGGSGISDPLAGYRPPEQASEGGRGLWLARQLVDLLQISTSPLGTRVRLHTGVSVG